MIPRTPSPDIDCKPEYKCHCGFVTDNQIDMVKHLRGVEGLAMAEAIKAAMAFKRYSLGGKALRSRPTALCGYE